MIYDKLLMSIFRLNVKLINSNFKFIFFSPQIVTYCLINITNQYHN
jgi:hypothetical protein